MSEQEYNSNMFKYLLVDNVANLGKYASLVLGISGVVGDEVSPKRIVIGAFGYFIANSYDYIARGRVQEIQRSKLEEKLKE